MVFTQALGTAAPRDGVRGVGINPGPVATDRVEMVLRAEATRQLGDPERLREAFRDMAFGRPVQPEEIAPRSDS
jgi:NAD(P)-dependent dehydrogenase (short-subunit alcohol dehydrogenase family)